MGLSPENLALAKVATSDPYLNPKQVQLLADDIEACMNAARNEGRVLLRDPVLKQQLAAAEFIVSLLEKGDWSARQRMELRAAVLAYRSVYATERQEPVL